MSELEQNDPEVEGREDATTPPPEEPDGNDDLLTGQGGVMSHVPPPLDPTP